MLVLTQTLSPSYFSIVYGPTKSRALTQNVSFSEACKATFVAKQLRAA